jgi:hypothetical protein
MPRLRGFNHWFALTTPSRLACRTRAVWQYRPAPSLSGLLPPTPCASRARLPPASATRCDGPQSDISTHSIIDASWRTTCSRHNPGKSQGRPNENPALAAHRPKRPAQLRSPNKAPVPDHPTVRTGPDGALEPNFHATRSGRVRGRRRDDSSGRRPLVSPGRGRALASSSRSERPPGVRRHARSSSQALATSARLRLMLFAQSTTEAGVLTRMEGSSDDGVFDSVGRRSAFHAKSPKTRWLPALEVAEKDGVVGVVGAVEL